MKKHLSKISLKKKVIFGIAYTLIALFGTKIGQGWHMAPGADFSEKFLHIIDGLKEAFSNPLPSFQPFDILIGCIITLVIACAVYVKKQNVKKFRKNEEYGSARCGAYYQL